MDLCYQPEYFILNMSVFSCDYFLGAHDCTKLVNFINTIGFIINNMIPHTHFSPFIFTTILKYNHYYKFHFTNGTIWTNLFMFSR